MFRSRERVAPEKALPGRIGADGVNLINSYGAAAWQSVFHFHMHVIPRYEGDPLQLPVKPGAGGNDLAAVAEELR